MEKLQQVGAARRGGKAYHNLTNSRCRRPGEMRQSIAIRDKVNPCRDGAGLTRPFPCAIMSPAADRILTSHMGSLPRSQPRSMR
ncbi:MAG: hypothetical protein JWN73_1152 [Betaproteobacteria bacterium]|nr:hypothetical protein [Betaproteobacteria bacterium]